VGAQLSEPLLTDAPPRESDRPDEAHISTISTSSRAWSASASIIPNYQGSEDHRSAEPHYNGSYFCARRPKLRLETAVVTLLSRANIYDLSERARRLHLASSSSLIALRRGTPCSIRLWSSPPAAATCGCTTQPGQSRLSPAPASHGGRVNPTVGCSRRTVLPGKGASCVYD
jgi:hypothetical protein